MKANRVFLRMQPARAARFFGAIQKDSSDLYTQLMAMAAVTLHARPQFVRRQKAEKRIATLRRGLTRVAASPLAEQVLAAYFLESRKKMLTEWLDLAGLEHKDGLLKEDKPPQPEKEKLASAVKTFLAGKEGDSAAEKNGAAEQGAEQDDRKLLLEAFISQSAIEWPELETLLGLAEPPQEKAPLPLPLPPQQKAKSAAKAKTSKSKAARAKAAAKAKAAAEAKAAAIAKAAAKAKAEGREPPKPAVPRGKMVLRRRRRGARSAGGRVVRADQPAAKSRYDAE